MGGLVPAPRRQMTAVNVTTTKLDRQTSRDIGAIQSESIVRMARVRADGMVQVEKVHELDRLSREAMSGHVMLSAWANHLAGENPVLADELRFFTDIARLAKVELISETADWFHRI